MKLGDRLDWVIILLAMWPITGALLDSMHHAMGGAESFWTWQHGLIYSGVLAIALALFYLVYRAFEKDKSIRESVPMGYESALLGTLMIILGGIGDMFWHSLFGVEQGMLEVGSASHLVLVLGAVLLASAQLRRAWYRGVGQTWKDQLPMLTSSAFLITVLSYLIWSLHPLVTPTLPVWSEFAGEELALLVGASGIVLYSSIFISIFLLLENRFELVKGSFLYIMGLGSFLIIVPSRLFIFLPACLLTGLIAELSRIYLRPSKGRENCSHLFSTLIPIAFSSLYLITVLLYGGTWWNVHEVSAFIVLPGIVGLLVSYLKYPEGRFAPEGVNDEI